MFDFRLFVCLPVLQSLMLYFYNLAFTNFKDQTIEVYIPCVVHGKVQKLILDLNFKS